MKFDSAHADAKKRITLDNDRLLQVGTLIYRPCAADNLDDPPTKYEILLITSRGSGRWIIPKGWPMKGHNLPQAAIIEAYEEAGIRGEIHQATIGSYHYKKKDMLAGENNRFEVLVFALLYQCQKKIARAGTAH